MSSRRSNDSSSRSAEEAAPLPGSGGGATAFASASRRLNRRYMAYLDKMAVARRVRFRRIVTALGLTAVAILALLCFGITHGVLAGWLALALAIPVVGVLPVAMVVGAVRESRSPGHQERAVVQSGVPVDAFLIQANPALFKPQRRRLPCLALVCFEPEVSQDVDYMRFLARRVYSMKNTRQPDPDGRYVAGLATDERMVPLRRRPLPLSFTDGSVIYCTDIWVRPSYLQRSCLESDVLPCIAEPGSSGGIELVPWWLVEEGDKSAAAPTAGHESHAS